MQYGERAGDSTDVFVYRTFKTTLYRKRYSKLKNSHKLFLRLWKLKSPYRRTSQILAVNPVHPTISKVSPENSHVSVDHV